MGLEGEPTRVRLLAVVALKAEHLLEVLLKVSGLARSTFFHHHPAQVP